ncbi:hypothetical protein AX15_002345 [Amanita polypyramis BW_CC]|nr:hypothetical protein AX15_002345 [Amanita polypyramis BW_CC]
MPNHVPWEAMQGPHPPVASMGGSPPHRTRAMTNPTHPQALLPTRRPSTVHTSDLFFVASAPRQTLAKSSTIPRNSPQTPTNSSITTSHVFHRSLTCPPPIPPKPLGLLQEQPETKLPPHVVEVHRTDMGETPNEEDELAAVLALSQTESARRQSMLEKLTSQEEDDLARALAESLKTASNAPGSTSSSESSNIAPPAPEEPVTAQPSPSDTPEAPTFRNEGKYKINGQAIASAISTQNLRLLIDSGVGRVSDPCANDIPRRLAEEEERKASENRTTPDDGGTSTSARQVPPHVVREEDKYVRQLAEKEAKMNGTRRPKSKSAIATVTPRIPDLPPPYEPSPSLPTTPVGISNTDLPASPGFARDVSAGASSSTQLESSTSGFEGSSNYLYNKHSSSNVGNPEQSYPTSPQQPIYLVARSVSSTSLSSPSTLPIEQEVSGQSGTVNPYLADELLNGVSIGFEPPVLSPQLSTWQKPLPTIISLPYNRSVPLHIQATSWRHMLKLMARLPGTSVQATLDAMAASKTEHKLRTVVQFVKPHLASSEWRTILWFTLEHPVPDDVTGRSRYVYDANVLPWSYTFSTPPQLLRGGTESKLSKTYTIPACSALMFPTLPITFPDLAMYLHTALEISRRYINDSSSGTRKLAKIIDTCYPDTNTAESDDPEWRGVSGLFKKVIGRNNRRRGGNEDTYELVTPFVASEWG